MKDQNEQDETTNTEKDMCGSIDMGQLLPPAGAGPNGHYECVEGSPAWIED